MWNSHFEAKKAIIIIFNSLWKRETHVVQRGEWPSGLYSLRQVTEVKLGRVRSDFGWVTTDA